MNTPEATEQPAATAQHAAQQAAESAPELTPEQQAQIEEAARQLATATPIPGVSSEMLEAGKEMLGAGVDALSVVADIAGLALTAAEVVGSVIGAVAEFAGNIDLGGS